MADETAEVVIVGGGVLGASTAFHLTELGITDVVLLERETLASGSTSKSAGGVRAQFADELNIRIALRSIAELSAFAERVGGEADFVQDGYLFLIDDEADLARFREALALQASFGVPQQFFDGEPSHSLHEAALDLPAIDERRNRIAHVLKNVDAQDARVARESIYLDFRNRCAIGEIVERLSLSGFWIVVNFRCAIVSLRE